MATMLWSLGFMPVVLAFDHAAKRCFIIATGLPQETAGGARRCGAARYFALAENADRCARHHVLPPPPAAPPSLAAMPRK